MRCYGQINHRQVTNDPHHWRFTARAPTAQIRDGEDNHDFSPQRNNTGAQVTNDSISSADVDDGHSCWHQASVLVCLAKVSTDEQISSRLARLLSTMSVDRFTGELRFWVQVARTRAGKYSSLQGRHEHEHIADRRCVIQVR